MERLDEKHDLTTVDPGILYSGANDTPKARFGVSQSPSDYTTWYTTWLSICDGNFGVIEHLYHLNVKKNKVWYP